MASTASKPIRTLTLASSPANPNAPGPTVALARQGSSVALLNTDPEDSPIWAMLSVLVSEDPFPGQTMDGHEMIWVRAVALACGARAGADRVLLLLQMKTYSENAGLFEQLERAGWIRECVAPSLPTFPHSASC